MTLFALATVIAAALQGAFAMFLLGLSRGPGWRSLRWLGMAALTGGLYAAWSLVFTLEDVSEPLRLLGARFVFFFGGLHSICWVLVSAEDAAGRKLWPLERAAVGGGFVICVLALIPGVLAENELTRRYIPVLGTTYWDAQPTPFGIFCLVYYTLAMCAVIAFNARRARRRVPGAMGRTLMLTLLLLAVGHDTLASLGILPTPYVVDLAFLAAVAVSGVSLTRRIIAESHALADSHRELEKVQAELVSRERLAALGELSAVVAHEVRNPLAVLFNVTARLRKIVVAGQESDKLLGMMIEECERLDRIVSDLLQFARPLPLRIERSSLTEIVVKAADAARLAAQGADVPIQLDLPKSVVELDCDPQLIRQALLNLLTNAIQVSTGRRPLQVRVQATRQGVTVEVLDDGPGIPPELRERIFRPFFTTRAQGTGLGLALSQKVAELHGGKIDVEPGPDYGSRFLLRLPLVQQAEETLSATARA